MKTPSINTGLLFDVGDSEAEDERSSPAVSASVSEWVAIFAVFLWHLFCSCFIAAFFN